MIGRTHGVHAEPTSFGLKLAGYAMEAHRNAERLERAFDQITAAISGAVGTFATLGPDCVYEIVPTGQRWVGHAGARAFYTELFGAFPDNAFALSDIVVGPQGVMEVATLTGTNSGPWAGAAPTGLPVSLQVLILFPWNPATERFSGERIWFDRGAIGEA